MQPRLLEFRSQVEFEYWFLAETGLSGEGPPVAGQQAMRPDVDGPLAM